MATQRRRHLLYKPQNEDTERPGLGHLRPVVHMKAPAWWSPILALTACNASEPTDSPSDSDTSSETDTTAPDCDDTPCDCGVAFSTLGNVFPTLDDAFASHSAELHLCAGIFTNVVYGGWVVEGPTTVVGAATGTYLEDRLVISGIDPVTLSSLTIRNSDGSRYSEVDIEGGAINVYNSGHLVLENVVLDGNSAGGCGGAIIAG